MSTNHDAVLIAAIEASDRSALERAYREHGGQMLGVATRILRDRALAEDAVQEVFIRLWQRPGRYDPDRGTLRTFLLRDTHGRAVDLLRSETARRGREERDQHRSSAPPAGTEEQVETTIRSERVRAALETLPEQERAAVELAFFGEMSYRQVAEQLGQPEGTVKSRIRSGLKRLQGPLTAEGMS